MLQMCLCLVDSKCYAVTKGAGTDGIDRGYCAENDDHATLYQAKWNDGDFWEI